MGQVVSIRFIATSSYAAEDFRAMADALTQRGFNNVMVLAGDAARRLLMGLSLESYDLNTLFFEGREIATLEDHELQKVAKRISRSFKNTNIVFCDLRRLSSFLATELKSKLIAYQSSDDPLDEDLFDRRFNEVTRYPISYDNEEGWEDRFIEMIRARLGLESPECTLVTLRESE